MATYRNIGKREFDDLLEAAEAALAYHGDIHPDACATNPAGISGADEVGPCDCFIGMLERALN